MTLSTIPTLETDRLILRGFTAEDFADYAAVQMHPENAKWLGGETTEAVTWLHMSVTIGQWTMRGYGRFCVRTKDNDSMVGIIGPLHPLMWPGPEISYTIHPDQKGKGYASEAVMRCLDWVYNDLKWPSVMSMIAPNNTASQGVARKCGAQLTDETFIANGEELQIWRYPPSQEFNPIN